MEAGSVVLSLLLSALAALLYCGARASWWLWLRPRLLERRLRRQGVTGSSFPLIRHTGEELRLIKEAWSGPMDLNRRIVPRVVPFTHHMVQRYGKTCLNWAGATPRLIICDQDLMKEVLLDKVGHYQKPPVNPLINLLAEGVSSLEGEEWAGRRRIISPAFHLERLKRMVLSFVNSTEGSCELDAWSEFQNQEGDVISRTAFGSSFEEGKRIFDLQKEQAVLAIEAARALYLPGFRFLPTAKNKRRLYVDGEIKTMLRAMIDRKLDSMRMGGSSSDDLLGLLLQSVEHSEQDKHGITIEDVMEECKLFYFDGQETTSVWLTWTLVLLSMHLVWQQRAGDEVLRRCGKNTPDFESIRHLKIVTMILHEVMRLYPLVVSLFRHTWQRTKLGDISLPGGVDLLLLPTILMHHDPQLWGEDAEEFNPDRFSEGISKASRRQNAFFPFGWGLRICLGQSFAMIEAKMALAIILQHFSFEPSFCNQIFLACPVGPSSLFIRSSEGVASSITMVGTNHETFIPTNLSPIIESPPLRQGDTESQEDDALPVVRVYTRHTQTHAVVFTLEFVVEDDCQSANETLVDKEASLTPGIQIQKFGEAQPQLQAQTVPPTGHVPPVQEVNIRHKAEASRCNFVFDDDIVVVGAQHLDIIRHHPPSALQLQVMQMDEHMAQITRVMAEKDRHINTLLQRLSARDASITNQMITPPVVTPVLPSTPVTADIVPPSTVPVATPAPSPMPIPAKVVPPATVPMATQPPMAATMTVQPIQLLVADMMRSHSGGLPPITVAYSKSYTVRIQQLRFPTGFQPPKFQHFDGKDNQRQHIAHFIETCNNAGTYGDKIVKQFVHTIKGNTFDWYVDLLPGSIDSWDQMKREVLNRFYSTRRIVSMVELAAIKQRKGEPMINYIDHWRNLMLNSQDHLYEDSVIEMCTHGMHWGLLYNLNGIKLRSFEDLVTRAHDMELSLVTRSNLKGKDLPKAEKKDKPEASKPKQGNVVDVTSTPKPLKISGKSDKGKAITAPPSQPRMSLAELEAKEYHFPDSKVPSMFDQLLQEKKIELPSFEDLATRPHDVELNLATRGDSKGKVLTKAKKKDKPVASKPKQVNIVDVASTPKPLKIGGKPDKGMAITAPPSQPRPPRMSLAELKAKEYPFPDSEVLSMFDQLLQEKMIELPSSKRPEQMTRVDDPLFCKYHRVVSHPIEKCFIFKEKIMMLAKKGKIEINSGNVATANMTSITFGSFSTVLVASQRTSPSLRINHQRPLTKPTLQRVQLPPRRRRRNTPPVPRTKVSSPRGQSPLVSAPPLVSEATTQHALRKRYEQGDSEVGLLGQPSGKFNYYVLYSIPSSIPMEEIKPTGWGSEDEHAKPSEEQVLLIGDNSSIAAPILPHGEEDLTDEDAWTMVPRMRKLHRSSYEMVMSAHYKQDRMTRRLPERTYKKKNKALRRKTFKVHPTELDDLF